MKSYSYLVNKHLKVHRKRTLLTILGIISGIILFFTIGYLTNYSKDATVISSINRSGDYDAVVFDVNKEDVKKLKNNIRIDKCGLYNVVSNINVELGNRKENMGIYELDDISISNIFHKRLHIKEGRIPKSDKEIMLNYTVKAQLDISINDKFDVDGIFYNIVGFYEEDNDVNTNSLNGFTYLDNDNIDKKVNVIFKLRNNKNKIKDIEAIVKDTGIYYGDIYDRNKIVLNYATTKEGIIRNMYGNIDFNEELISIYCLNLFVLILTIVLTYGSINISLNERQKEFAALRCMGATPSKLKKLLIKESIILGAFSIMPGLIIAQILCWVIIYRQPSKGIEIGYDILNGTVYLNVVVNTIIFITANIFFANIILLRKVGKLSPIEILKDKNIYNKNIKIRNSKLIRRLFGYSGELAYKNVRANNKSFILTVFTISILLIGTISLSGYNILTNKYYEETVKGLTDISITFDIEDEVIEKAISIDKIIKESKKFIKEVKSLDVDSELYTNITLTNSSIIEGAAINKNIRESTQFKTINLNGKEGVYSQRIRLIILDDEYTNKILPYIKSDGEQIDKLGSNDFIVVNHTSTNNKLNIKRVPPLTISVGDTIKLYLSKDSEINNIEKVSPIKMNYLGSIESKDLIGANRFGYYSYLTLIVSEDFYLHNKDLLTIGYDVMTNVLLNIEKNQNKKNVLSKISDYASIKGANVLQEKSGEIEYKTQSEVLYNLIYTGLILVILISCVNLINMKSVEISLREKEFKILLAIGAKKSKLKKIIFLEGIITWFISSLIGGSISIIILNVIKAIYVYQGFLQDTPIPYYIILIYIIILLLISIITSIAPYKKLKNIELNNLIKNEE